MPYHSIATQEDIKSAILKTTKEFNYHAIELILKGKGKYPLIDEVIGTVFKMYQEGTIREVGLGRFILSSLNH